MRVRITHTTRLDYDAEVAEGVMDIHLGPLTDPHQRWERFNLRVSPSAAVRQYYDAIGNTAHLVTIGRPHQHVEIIVEGEVQTTLADPFALPMYYPEPLNVVDRHDYLSSSGLVPEAADFLAVAAPFAPATPEDTFESARSLNDWAYNNLKYQANVTTVNTTAIEALTERVGVCQDFSHVLIGLCRAVGIPARYVSGYIVPGASNADRAAAAPAPLADEPQWRGLSGPDGRTGASHAWVEAYSPTHGWRGFDPTNNVLANEHHVKVAVGRDYRDIPPTRGTFRGAAEEVLSVEVVATAVR